MSKLVKEPCPKCGKDVEVTLPEAGEAAGVPKFCGWCGARLYSSCPSCSFKLTHLFEFCPECRTRLTEGEPEKAVAPPPEPAPPVVSEPECVVQLRRDLAEVEPFWRAAADLLIKLNPVSFRGSQFAGRLKHVTAETSSKQDAETLKRAVEVGDLSAIGESMDRYAEALVRSIRDLTQGWYPPLQEAHHLRARIAVSPSLLANLSTALRSKAKLAEELRSGFLAVKQGLPRFQEIAAKSHVWRFVIDVTVTSVFPTAGPVVQTLRNVQGASDQEFLQAYQESLGKLAATWGGFGDQLIQAAAPALDQIFSSLSAQIEEVLGELARLAASGTDVAPAVARLQLGWRPVEVWEQFFVNDVLNELKTRGTAEPSLDRLRALCTNGRPWQIEKWPELKLNIEWSLRTQGEELLKQKIQEILGSSRPDCCLAPEIPEAKLQNAVSTYAHAVDPNRIVFLYDDTIFGGAKEGFCLTIDELFWHNLSEPVHGRALQGISTIRSADGPDIGIDGDALKVTTQGIKEKMLAVLLAARDQAHAPQAPAGVTRQELLGKMATTLAAAQAHVLQRPAAAGPAA